MVFHRKDERLSSSLHRRVRHAKINKWKTFYTRCSHRNLLHHHIIVADDTLSCIILMQETKHNDKHDFHITSCTTSHRGRFFNFKTTCFFAKKNKFMIFIHKYFNSKNRLDFGNVFQFFFYGFIWREKMWIQGEFRNFN